MTKTRPMATYNNERKQRIKERVQTITGGILMFLVVFTISAVESIVDWILKFFGL